MAIAIGSVQTGLERSMSTGVFIELYMPIAELDIGLWEYVRLSKLVENIKNMKN